MLETGCTPYLSIYPSIHLSIHPSIYLSTYLPAFLPTYLPTHLPTYLPNYLPPEASQADARGEWLFVDDAGDDWALNEDIILYYSIV